MAVKSKLKRCPFRLKVCKETEYDSEGRVISVSTSQEYMECYKKYCIAWSEKKETCLQFQELGVDLSEADEDDGDKDSG